MKEIITMGSNEQNDILKSISSNLKKIENGINEFQKQLQPISYELVDIPFIDDLSEYLSILAKKNNIIIAISVKDTIGAWLDEHIQTQLREFGIKSNLVGVWERGFIALVKNRSCLYEKVGEKNKSFSYFLQISNIDIKIYSKPLNDGNKASIKVDDHEYAVSRRGLNIVVIEENTGKVIDSVAFDTHSAMLKCYRTPIYRNSLNNIEYLLHKKNTSDSNKQRRDNSEKQYFPSRTWDNPYFIKRVKALSVKKLFSLNDTINIHIIWWGSSIFWNFYHSLCKSFAVDKKYQVTMVFYSENDLNEKINLCNKIGIHDFIRFSDYDIELERPDILFLPVIDSPWYDEKFLRKIRDNVNYFVTMMIGDINNYCTNNKVFAENLINLYLKYDADALLFGSFVYKELKKSGMLTKECIKVGNPKYDELYNTLNEDTKTHDGWEKLDGKTVFVWATDHNWDSGLVSFDLYAKAIFKFFKEHTEAALIFRPHRRYIEELISSGVWTQNDLQIFRNNFSSSENMVFDETSDFSLSYKLADAIITDSRTGMLITALPTDVPIAVFERFDDTKKPYYHNYINKHYYDCCSIQDATDFLKMVLSKEDYKKDNRKKAFDYAIGTFDGKNGIRIKQFIDKEYTSLVFSNKEKKIFNMNNRLTGIQQFGNRKYFINEDGSIHLGWKTLMDKQYYFARTSNVYPKGSLVEGLFFTDGFYYYFEDELYKNRDFIVDGKRYHADNDGKVNIICYE